MEKIGVNFPVELRKTALHKAEDWYQHFLSEKMDVPYQPLKRKNFGHYDMAINYLTSVMEEAKAIDKVAVFNIDHMAQIKFWGKDSEALLNRVLPADISKLKVGKCKYTILMNEEGIPLDDLIIMRLSEESFMLVINAGHDITDEKDGKKYISDSDFIFKFKKDEEEVFAKDISDELVKVDIQGKFSFKVLKKIFGEQVLKNRYKPEKNMPFFSFNEFKIDENTYYLSRTGYTNRWGFELYLPIETAEEKFKEILEYSYELGGLLVGLGGRDENRISAGNAGLPLMGSEYDGEHVPTNCPLFDSAVDMNKEYFISKEALENEIAKNPDKGMVILVTESIAIGRGIYLDGKRLGTVTSSIVSPNVSQEQRDFLNSKRKNVNKENGTAGVNLAWLYEFPFEKDEKGRIISEKDGERIRIKVDLFREDKEGNIKGRAMVGYMTAAGINPASSYRPLKHIAKL